MPRKRGLHDCEAHDVTGKREDVRKRKETPKDSQVSCFTWYAIRSVTVFRSFPSPATPPLIFSLEFSRCEIYEEGMQEEDFEASLV